MNKKPIALIALCVLVTFSGCTGIFDAPQNSSIDTTPNGSTIEITDYPSSYSEDGVSDVESAINSHEESLFMAGSWAVNVTSTMNSNRTTEIKTQTAVANNTTSRSILAYESGELRQVFYNNKSETFVRREGSRRVAHRYDADLGYSASESTYSYFLPGFLDRLNYTQTAVSNKSGTLHITYTATEKEKDILNQTDSGVNQSISDIESQFTVTETGMIKEFTLNGTVQSDNSESEISFRYIISDIGITTVEYPEWLDEAKSELGITKGE